MGWRMIYDNERVYSLFETNGKTFTKRSVFNADTEEECFDKIDDISIYHEAMSGDTTMVTFSGGNRTYTTIEVI